MTHGPNKRPIHVKVGRPTGVVSRGPLPDWARGKSGWYLDLGYTSLLVRREAHGYSYGFFGDAVFTRSWLRRDAVMVLAEDWAIAQLDKACAVLRRKVDIDVAVPRKRSRR